jgi:hypothetical protein
MTKSVTQFAKYQAMIALLICLSVSIAQAQTRTEILPTGSGYWKEKVQTLPTVQGGWTILPESLVVSPDCVHMAYKMQRGIGIIVVLDGIPSPVYRKVGELAFSENHNQLYYRARELGAWFIVRNHRPYNFREFIADPVISPNGYGWAAIFKSPIRQQLCVNGEDGPQFDEIDGQSIRFSPDSKQLAYFARRGHHWYVQINDKTAGPYQEVIDAPTYDAQSQQLAYIAKHNGQWYVVQNNEPWTVANDATGLQFHPKSNKLYAWLRTTSNNWQLYCNNSPIDTANSSSPATLIFGNHISSWAARLTVGSQTQMIRDGRLLPINGYILPDSAQFGPKNIQLVYVTRTNAGEHLTVDGDLLEPYQTIQTTDIRMAPNGLRIAYVAKMNGQWHVVDHDKPGPIIDPVLPNSLQFSPDFEQLYYRTQSGPFVRLYMNNRMIGEFDEMTPPVYLTRGNHMAWAARIAHQWHMYVDGFPNPTHFTDIVGTPRVAGDLDHFRTFVIQMSTAEPTYNKLMMEKLTADEALANVEPGSIE